MNGGRSCSARFFLRQEPEGSLALRLWRFGLGAEMDVPLS